MGVLDFTQTRVRAGVLLLALAAACTAPAGESGPPVPTVHPQLWPGRSQHSLMQPRIESFVEQLLSRMTLEEKVGQMIQADINSITPAELRDYPLGAVLAGGNSGPDHDVRSSAQRWLDLADAYYAAALQRAPAGHVAIPILFGIDAVHGHARVPGATIFPHNIGLGAAHDPELVRRIGAATAEEVATTGIDWTFAPVVAVARDVRWGRTYESYSEDPRWVAQYAAAMVSGLQGELQGGRFMASGQTLATVKHFLGDGGTIDGRDQFDNLAAESVLLRVHGAGYPAAIGAGALVVMASFSSWHGVKMHANRALLTDVLKNRLGFDGFVVSDWNAQEEIPGCTRERCAAAVLAGVDMFMAPASWKGLYRNMLAQVRSGEIPQPRIDDAVRRILRVKALVGLFERPAPKVRPEAGHFERLGSPEHRALAREAVRKSLVLLKN
jgi:beta-glucosidase